MLFKTRAARKPRTDRTTAARDPFAGMSPREIWDLPTYHPQADTKL